MWSGSVTDVTYRENLLKKAKKLHTKAEAVYGRSLSHLYLGRNYNYMYIYIYYASLANSDYTQITLEYSGKAKVTLKLAKW